MHYTLLVISDENQDIDELLAPYSESLKVEPYIRITKNQFIERGKQEVTEKLKILEEEGEDGYIRHFSQDSLTQFREHWKREGKPTDEDYFKFATRYYSSDEFDADGNYWSTYNPKSKYDYYSVGGRWDCSLELKDGTSADEAIADQVDWDKMNSIDPTDEHWAKILWKYYIEEVPFDEGITQEEIEQLKKIMWKREYFIDKYHDLDTYIKAQKSWCTWAVLTPDGEWHEPGEMGWFASSASPEEELQWNLNFYDTFIKTLKGSEKLTTMDLHI